MNSFISSFKPIFAALLVIASFETAVTLTLHPSDVQRSNFLGLRYATPEHGHRYVLYEKLRDFGESSPDIIQVGDSSGFFGVNPDIVMSYLNGMNYVNLSCCANTGYEGYYSIASYMFRHNPSIKTLVLYIGLDNLPRSDLLSGDTGADGLHESFDSVWSLFMPPSMALRERITEDYYTFWGVFRHKKEYLAPGEEFRRVGESIRTHHGWSHEKDARLTGKALEEYWNTFCGPEDVMTALDDARFYQPVPLHGTRSLPAQEFSRFAALAARYNARLVIMLQPLVCGAADIEKIRIRRDEIRTIDAKYHNVTVIPDGMVTHWPREAFTSVPHLRVGYDVANSHRVGRVLSAALGITPRAPLAEPVAPITLATDVTPAVWKKSQFTGVEWTKDGATTQSRPGQGDWLMETPAPGWHRLMATIGDTRPDTPYVFSVVFKPENGRGLKIEMSEKDGHGQYGYAICNPEKLRSARYGDTIDADMEILPDGWYRCWTSMSYARQGSTYSIALAQEENSAYTGDGKSGIMIREAQLQPGGKRPFQRHLPH